MAIKTVLARTSKKMRRSISNLICRFILFSFSRAAEALESESGITLESPLVRQVRTDIADGAWDKVGLMRLD